MASNNSSGWMLATTAGIAAGAALYYLAPEKRQHSIEQEKIHVRTTLDRLSVADLAERHKTVIVGDGSWTLDQALLRLQDKNLLAMPIADVPTGRYIGVLSVLGVARYLAQLQGARAEAAAAGHESKSWTLPDIEVHEIPLDPIVCRPLSGPLSSLIPLFAAGVGRVYLTEKASMRSIFSQSQLVQLIYRRLEEMDSFLLRASLAETGICDQASQFLTVSSSDIITNVLEMIATDGVLAVVDSAGALEGDISAGSLRRMSSFNMYELNKTIADFGMYKELRLAKRSTSFGVMLAHMVEAKQRRVWVVDDDNSPIACLTLLSVIANLWGRRQPAITSL